MSYVTYDMSYKSYDIILYILPNKHRRMLIISNFYVIYSPNIKNIDIISRQCNSAGALGSFHLYKLPIKRLLMGQMWLRVRRARVSESLSLVPTLSEYAELWSASK